MKLEGVSLLVGKRIIASLLFSLLVGTQVCLGQSQTPELTLSQAAGLTITIVDPNDAVVPGATITVSGRNVLPRIYETGADGTIRIESDVTVGLIVAVEARQFSKTVKKVETTDIPNMVIVLSPGVRRFAFPFRR